ncbi:hypothetical protein NQ318_003482, partial [Aromia moschata]
MLFCKKHFSVTQFYPIHDEPTMFACSQWQQDKSRPNLIYLMYRCAVAVTFLVTWILSIVKDKDGGSKWPIFLTNWGYTMCTLQALIALGMLSTWILVPNLKEKAFKVYPLYWVLHTVATPLAFGITFMYWIVIYDAKRMPFNAMNYFVHGNNSILMMIDLWMVAHPIRILHFVYPAVCGVTYTIFSVIYYSAGGTGTNKEEPKCIYRILDWDRPLSTALTCVGVTIFLICLHFLVYLVTKLKISVYQKCCSAKSDESYMAETKAHPAAYVNEGMSND